MLGVIIGYEDNLNELADMRMKVKFGKFGGKKHLPCELRDGGMGWERMIH